MVSRSEHFRFNASGFSTLIGAIYDAAVPGGCMESALEQFQSLTGVESVGLIKFDHSNGTLSETVAGSPTVMEFAGFPDDSRKAFCEYFFQINPIIKIDKDVVSAGDMSFITDLFDHRDWLQSEFYTDYLRLLSWDYLAGAYLVHTKDITLTLNASRSFKMGDFNADERKLWKFLVPHFQRALSMRNEFNVCQAEKTTICEGLDRLRTGVVLIDGSGAVVLVNAEGRRLCGSAYGLDLRQGIFSALNPTSNRRLQTAISNAIGFVRGTGEIGGGTVAIARRNGKRPLAVQCIPVTDRMEDHFGSSPAAIVFIRDPERSIDASSELLQVLFDLTPTEARVAQAIADGKSLSECARHFGQSIHTTRSHVKKAFSKTGVRGQAELASIVLKVLSV